MPYQIAVRTQAGNSAHPQCISVGNINAHTDWSQALEGVTDVVHLAARVHIAQETSTDAYAVSKWEAEQGLWEISAETCM